MVPAIKRTSILWSKVMHLHPGTHRSCGTAGAGYQRSLDIKVQEEHNHLVLAVESVVGFAAPALVGVSAPFAGP